MLITLVVCLIASLGGASVLAQVWNSRTGRPATLNSDGVNIFPADASKKDKKRVLEVYQ